MDSKLFMKACDKVIHQTKVEDGIGTIGEKTIHSVIKHYLSPNEASHEVKLMNFYADIYTPDGIIEIQTRSFDKLRKKLETFLEIAPVTIVYPIAYTKWLRWVSQDTGEVSTPRKSPKKGSPYSVFPELYKIKNYLLHPNLKLNLLLINVEEYRYLDGWSVDKKKGSSRCDGIPLELVDEIYISDLEDYKKLIPDSLPLTFTSKDYKKCSGINQKNAVTALNILHHVGAVERIGKDKRAYLYSR